MKIYFDGIEVSEDYVISLTNDATLFTDKFYLGATVCREVSLEVLAEGVQNNPQNVVITDDSDTPLYFLHVDNIDNDDYTFYRYTLLDSMVFLNKSIDYPSERTMV